MKNIDFSNKVNIFVNENIDRISFGDQQIINELFQDSISLIPLRWNVTPNIFRSDWRQRAVGRKNHLSLEEMCVAAADPAIVHFTGPKKPWHGINHPYTAMWFHYLELSGFGDFVERPSPPKHKSGSRSLRLVPKRIIQGLRALLK